jgi:IMP dehydrogenase/GMP reductase
MTKRKMRSLSRQPVVSVETITKGIKREMIRKLMKNTRVINILQDVDVDTNTRKEKIRKLTKNTRKEKIINILQDVDVDTNTRKEKIRKLMKDISIENAVTKLSIETKRCQSYNNLIKSANF